MDSLLAKLQLHYPTIGFKPGPRFSWSPANNQVIYKLDSEKSDKVAIWSLFHELAHALLGHNAYKSDFELLSLEAAAWHKAQELAKSHKYIISSDHIEDCLDTYRDWLYQRSTCPKCTSCSLQIDSKTYCCFNCGTTWRVSASRLCRPYRLKQKEVLI